MQFRICSFKLKSGGRNGSKQGSGNCSPALSRALWQLSLQIKYPAKQNSLHSSSADMVQRRLCLIIEIQIMTTLLSPVHPFNCVPKELVLSWRWDSVCEHQSEKSLLTQGYLHQRSNFFCSGRLRKPPLRKYKTWLNLLKVMSPVDMGIGYDNSIRQSSKLVRTVSSILCWSQRSAPRVDTMMSSLFLKSLKLFSGKDAEF